MQFNRSTIDEAIEIANSVAAEKPYNGVRVAYDYKSKSATEPVFAIVCCNIGQLLRFIIALAAFSQEDDVMEMTLDMRREVIDIALLLIFPGVEIVD